ncbi:GNAT family N-acetyltransferase [Tranquillimonas alkanivorans]|uniref:Phosphinothricin acetyltransferase n=1 Tax=Tranquillimonas alkanivorans TaxID=441119 RepID=A0A1I5N6I8_9RHOB|nr:GNAT family N-acetyltransferase [Tranquillimonas alkanivorans]SFP17202.1 phosphinothricin acetyltransferase [Tranquillimonas alkanivorans]
MIRPARPDDAPGICAIWNGFIRDTLVTFNPIEKTPEDVAALISGRARDGHGTFVADSDGRIDGFATYGQFRSGVGYARTMEHTVLLSPAAQGRGTGRALMDELIAHARAGGAHSLFAGVSSGNPVGRAFHARLGFEEVAVLPKVGFKNDHWLDLHLMQLRL